MQPEWTIVIPVKGTAGAKSRLFGTPELALAIALDTVEVALTAAPVIVVTSPQSAAAFEQLGAVVIADPTSGLADAVRAGISAAGSGAVAVMLGDLPALRPDELADSLAAAALHRLTMVADVENEGTTLITALRAEDHVPAFGAGSRAAHRASGYTELAVSLDSGLRRDVDTPAHLSAVASRVGPRTALAMLSSR